MQRSLRRMIGGLALCLLLPGLLAAQAPKSEKEMLIEDWTRFQGNVKKYIEAMPDSAFAFRPTPGVRTFGEQIEHILMANVMTAAVVTVPKGKVISLGDTAAYRTSKRALLAATDSAFSHSMSVLRGLNAAQLARDVALFGETRPAGRWFRIMHEHGVWTLGQTVPYLRLNGVTPPGYLPF